MTKHTNPNTTIGGRLKEEAKFCGTKRTDWRYNTDKNSERPDGRNKLVGRRACGRTIC